MIKKQKTRYMYALVVALLLVVGLVALSGTEAYANCDYKGNILDEECDPTKDGLAATGIWPLLLLTINILTAGVGILAVGGVVYASIRYATAGGNTEQTKQAMKLLGNITIGVIAYALMYSFLNFLIPGGLFEP